MINSGAPGGPATRTQWKIECIEPVAANGMVAAKHPLSVEAGVRVLQAGGNAVDAAVTVAFAQNVVDPAMNGLGGGGFMLYYEAATGHTHVIDYFMTAPSAASAGMYEIVDAGKTDTLGYRGVKDDANTFGHRSVGVPGMARGMAEALQRFGTISMDQALAPAIEFAESGFEATWYSMLVAGRYMEVLARYPQTARIFLKEGRHLWRTGGNGPTDRIYQKELAESLRRVAECGADGFYLGETAERIDAEMRAGGGHLSAADLASYSARTPAARSIHYRDRYEIIYAPATGGGTLAEAFNILEGYDFSRMRPGSAEALQPYIEASRIAYADRWQHLADEECEEVPYALLESKPYAEERRREIARGRAGAPPAPWAKGTGSSGMAERAGGHTTHLSVVDHNGNMVAITQTINMVWGSGLVIPGTGILMNDAMVLFDPQPGRPNSIAPGKRPLSSMAPVLVLRDGKPFLTVGAPGGRLIMGTVMQVLHNVMDFEMGIQDACANLYVDVVGESVMIDSAVGAATLDEMRSMGYHLDVRARDYLPHIFASPTGILVDDLGQKHGGVDPYHVGIAAGY